MTCIQVEPRTRASSTRRHGSRRASCAARRPAAWKDHARSVLKSLTSAALLLAALSSLSGCGDTDSEEEDGAELGELEAAVTIPNLHVAAHPCVPASGGKEVACQCDTTWLLDSTHDVYSSCRVQKWDGSKFVTVSPIVAKIGKADGFAQYSTARTVARTRCVPGTYRGWAGGKVRFSGGWTELIAAATPHSGYYTINRCP